MGAADAPEVDKVLRLQTIDEQQRISLGTPIRIHNGTNFIPYHRSHNTDVNIGFLTRSVGFRDNDRISTYDGGFCLYKSMLVEKWVCSFEELRVGQGYILTVAESGDGIYLPL